MAELDASTEVRTLWLELKAPFAAYRWLQAGVYRATSPVIPPSAAWGLVLSLAAIETRDLTSSEGITPVDLNAPPLQLCVGRVGQSGTSTLLQQLHTYPVGSSGKELKERTHGAKYWIAPVRREFLVDLHCIVGVRCSKVLAQRIESGLAGAFNDSRYGVPFAGDNQLLFDRITLHTQAPEARWYEPMAADSRPTAGSCRLTVGIDRRDSSRTRTVLFAPQGAPTRNVPEQCWVWTPRVPGEVSAAS